MTAMNLVLLLLLTLLPVAFIGTVVWSIRTKAYASLSRVGIAASIVPGLVMSLSFYALALHMHAVLGGWPTSIGEAGFPPGLVRHANMTLGYFGVMILSSLFVWPLALAVCAGVPRLRGFIRYLSLLAASFAVNFALMLLAPSQFLSWWWD